MREAVLEIVDVAGRVSRLRAEIADSYEEKRLGMSGRFESLPMFFPNPRGGDISMTTRGMRFPIWIAFLDRLYVVRRIDRYEPGQIVPTMGSVHGVLEIPAVGGRSLPVTVGARLRTIGPVQSGA